MESEITRVQTNVSKSGIKVNPQVTCHRHKCVGICWFGFLELRRTTACRMDMINPDGSNSCLPVAFSTESNRTYLCFHFQANLNTQQLQVLQQLQEQFRLMQQHKQQLLLQARNSAGSPHQVCFLIVELSAAVVNMQCSALLWPLTAIYFNRAPI